MLKLTLNIMDSNQKRFLNITVIFFFIYVFLEVADVIFNLKVLYNSALAFFFFILWIIYVLYSISFFFKIIKRGFDKNMLLLTIFAIVSFLPSLLVGSLVSGENTSLVLSRYRIFFDILPIFTLLLSIYIRLKQGRK